MSENNTLIKYYESIGLKITIESEGFGLPIMKIESSEQSITVIISEFYTKQQIEKMFYDIINSHFFGYVRLFKIESIIEKLEIC